MSDQDNGQVTTLQRPTNDDSKAWREYWKAKDWQWRTEPEIDAERQKYLTERRTIVPDIEQGIYPFKDISLSRADVEWLLVTHENGRGPVTTDDALRWGRRGIDIRGGNLRGIDLRRLPLAGVFGGLSYAERNAATQEKREMAAVHMEDAKLNRTHLEHARLHEAHLEKADFEWAYMEEANLRGAHLDGARLHFSYLKGAFFRDASLSGADFTGAFLEQTRFVNVVLSDEEGSGPLFADAQWEYTNLALVKWSQKSVLGDEYKARQKTLNGQLKDKLTRLDEYERAVRANRQLAATLQAQGLNEAASHFAYRAQKLQREVLWRQKKLGQYLFSGFLDLLAGYGYHPLRTLFWYVVTVCAFAFAYHQVWVAYDLEKVTHHPLSYVGAIIFSITAFHGRGFFLGGDFGYDSLITILAALEAVMGLFVEISFIATFTQQFFGR